MSNLAIVSDNLETESNRLDQYRPDRSAGYPATSDSDLAASITKSASKQTYYTIRFLVDRDRINDAYRAYAYFRWVDDWLDTSSVEPHVRMAFVERQQTLIEGGYLGHWECDLTAEEHMLVDLIRADHDQTSGLCAYMRHMMAVMAFDANRRGCLVSQQELTDYTQHLAMGVSEAMHYFIGHGDSTPHTEARYLAVSAAHIAHMLRDTIEDVAADYFNIPREFLEAHGGLDPADVHSDGYRAWVKSRVQLARTYFEMGRSYLAQIKNRRCRIAGFAYVARFEGVLDAIEREGYRLRAAYPERKRLGATLRMGWTALGGLFGLPSIGRQHTS